MQHAFAGHHTSAFAFRRKAGRRVTIHRPMVTLLLVRNRTPATNRRSPKDNRPTPNPGHWQRGRKTGTDAVDPVRVDISARSLAILKKQAQVVADDIFGTALVGSIARTLGIVMIGSGCQRTPIVRIDVAPHLALAEPVSVPMTDGNLVHVVVRLKRGKGFELRQLPTGFAQILLSTPIPRRSPPSSRSAGLTVGRSLRNSSSVSLSYTR